mmetsp:Transcript_41401/g.58264  ORF Transcript_41401/g.58264 Transcript_41401/m.58264 type:complete len:181 (+) Transcript_41401:104-646(+)
MGDSADLFNILQPSTAYPQVVDGTCIVQAWEYGHAVGVLDVIFDADGIVTSCLGQPIIPYEVGQIAVDNEDNEFNITDAAQIEIETVLNASPSLQKTIQDEAALAALNQFASQIDELSGRIIGVVPETICFERIPGQGRSNLCSFEASNVQGGGACNVVVSSLYCGICYSCLLGVILTSW